MYSSGIFNKKYDETLLFWHENFKYFLKQLQSWKGFEMYVDKFAILEKRFFVKGKEIFTSHTNGLNVLNHGYVHIDNIMVKNDLDSKDNVLFVSKFS